jgi:hypothetical protein
MSNMSYCRFTNTLGDLEDCVEHMGDPVEDDERSSFESDVLSEAEARARDRMIELCVTIAQDYGDMDDG